MSISEVHAAPRFDIDLRRYLFLWLVRLDRLDGRLGFLFVVYVRQALTHHVMAALQPLRESTELINLVPINLEDAPVELDLLLLENWQVLLQPVKVFDPVARRILRRERIRAFLLLLIFGPFRFQDCLTSLQLD